MEPVFYAPKSQSAQHRNNNVYDQINVVSLMHVRSINKEHLNGNLRSVIGFLNVFI